MSDVQLLILLRRAMSNGSIVELKDKIVQLGGYDEATTQRLIRQPEFLRQTILELDQQIDPILRDHFSPKWMPTLHIDLLVKLQDLNKKGIKYCVRTLSLGSDVARKLIQDSQYREYIIQALEEKLNIWAATFPDINKDFLARLPPEITSFFDKQEFIQGMISGLVSLKHLALMAIPAGVAYLERVFDFPLSGDRDNFLRFYEINYYSRRMIDNSFYAISRNTERVALYRDEPMIKYFVTTRPDCLEDILQGLIKGGHLDLVQKYLPLLPPGNKRQRLLHLALSTGGLEMSLYIEGQSPGLDESCLTAAAQSGNVELFRYVHQKYDNGDLPHDLPRDIVAAAAGHNRLELLKYLETLPGFDPEYVVHAAFMEQNVKMMRRCASYYWAIDSEQITHMFANSDNIKIVQALYDAGARPNSYKLFSGVGDVDSNLEVLNFNLDHFELESLQDASPDYILRYILVNIINSVYNFDNRVIDLVLGHPKLAKHQPLLVLRSLIFEVPEDIVGIQIEDSFKGKAFEFMIHRIYGYDYIDSNYLRGISYAIGLNDTNLFRTIISYTQRKGFKFSNEIYQMLSLRCSGDEEKQAILDTMMV